MTMNYLETAKANIDKTIGDHPVEVTKALALVAIAYALIAIAERLEVK